MKNKVKIFDDTFLYEFQDYTKEFFKRMKQHEKQLKKLRKKNKVENKNGRNI